MNGVATLALAVWVAVLMYANSRRGRSRIDRSVRHPLPGFCEDCGGSQLTRAGQCATCGSDAVWTPGGHELPALYDEEAAKAAACAEVEAAEEEDKAAARREIARRAMERYERARSAVVIGGVQ